MKHVKLCRLQSRERIFYMTHHIYKQLNSQRALENFTFARKGLFNTIDQKATFEGGGVKVCLAMC